MSILWKCYGFMMETRTICRPFFLKEHYMDITTPVAVNGYRKYCSIDYWQIMIKIIIHTLIYIFSCIKPFLPEGHRRLNKYNLYLLCMNRIYSVIEFNLSYLHTTITTIQKSQFRRISHTYTSTLPILKRTSQLQIFYEKLALLLTTLSVVPLHSHFFIL